MNKSFRLFFRSLGLLITLSSTSAFAAELIPLQRVSLTEVTRLFQVQTQDVLKSSQNHSKYSLHALRQHRDHKNILHVRLQQYYLGVPVFGGYAIVHGAKSARQLIPETASPVSMNGVVYKGLSADLDEHQPGPSAQNQQQALQAFKAQFLVSAASNVEAHPTIYIDKDKQAHWAYQITAWVMHNDKIPERPTAIMDAFTFQTYLKWNNVKQARALVKGKGFGGNTHVGLSTFGETFPLLDLMRDNDSDQCYMENNQVKVINMAHRYMGYNFTMRFKCPEESKQSDGSYYMGVNADGYDEVNGAYSPSNDALYEGGVIVDMYKNWYGINALEKNNKPMKLLMRVHFGRDYENAFWDDEQMTFGDGGDWVYPLVSLGIAAHEISHGFTEQHSGLVYKGQSGGLNESFSDMAAQAAEYYSMGKASWRIGAEIMKENNGMEVMRYMDTPSRDGQSIDRADQYTDEMDVHYTSGVYNRFFYLLATQPGWDPRKAFQVMLAANADYWTPTSTFEEAACGIIEAGKQLDVSVEDIKFALNQVAVNYSDCL